MFLVVAYLGMWLAMTPLLVGGYQRQDARDDTGTLPEVCIALAMFAPAVAAVVVLRYVEPATRLRTALALRLPAPRGRAVRACLTALAVPTALTLASLALGAATGVYTFGPLDVSGIVTTGLAMLVQTVVSLPLFFGEELGWQGYLFPRLSRDAVGGRLVWAYVATGVAFATWHLPTLLMGGQYPGRPWYVSVPAMVMSCTLGLPIFTWLRTRSDSVLPAVIGHGVVSTASVGVVKAAADSDVDLDPLHMGLFGWPGWIVMGAFVAFLAVTGRLSLPAHGGSPEPARKLRKKVVAG